MMKGDPPTPEEQVLVRLRGELVTWKHGSISAVAAATGLSKANLSRWTNAYIPKASELLSLAEQLDVDPMALLDFRPWSMTTVGRRLATQMLTRKNWLQLGRVVSVLPTITRYLLGLDAAFPPDGIFDWKLPRPWHRFIHEHRARDRRNLWLRLTLIGTLPAPAPPQLWHFAWRDRFRDHDIDSQSWWKPYGTVLRQDGRVLLEHHNGMRASAVGVDRSFVVETWLGGGDADFTIASLHPFHASASFSTAPHDVTLPTVRFGDPPLADEAPR